MKRLENFDLNICDQWTIQSLIQKNHNLVRSTRYMLDWLNASALFKSRQYIFVPFGNRLLYSIFNVLNTKYHQYNNIIAYSVQCAVCILCDQMYYYYRNKTLAPWSLHEILSLNGSAVHRITTIAELYQ